MRWSVIDWGYSPVIDVPLHPCSYEPKQTPPLLKEAKETLTARLGLSFRNENYRSPLTPDINAAGLDVGINHTLTFDSAALVNRVSFVPSFNDFANFRLTHESFLELPIAASQWKLRLGINNDYNSKPGKGVDKLDTGYFTRLVLSWK